MIMIMARYLIQELDVNIATDRQVSELCQDNFTAWCFDAGKGKKAAILAEASVFDIGYEDDAQFVQEVSEEGLRIVL